VWEITRNGFEEMSGALRKSVMNGDGRSVQLVVEMKWPGRMTAGGGNNCGL
jgi:hypothetical protein